MYRTTLDMCAWADARGAIAMVSQHHGVDALGREILTGSGFNFTVAEGMKDAAEKVVRLAQ